MSIGASPSDDAIREQAYYLWEQDGKPDGKGAEYWHRASILLMPQELGDALVAPPPKKGKSAPVKTVASKAKAVPAQVAKSKAEPAKLAKDPTRTKKK